MEVEGYPNYLVYEDGRVFSKTTRKMMKPHMNNAGYWYVGLWRNQKRKQFYLHRLIAMVYVPNPENKPEVDHIDKDKSNNCVSNLRWATRSENSQHTGAHHNNKLGIKNICWNKKQKQYRYQKVFRGDCHDKWFKTLEEAIAYKEEYEKSLCIKD